MIDPPYDPPKDEVPACVPYRMGAWPFIYVVWSYWYYWAHRPYVMDDFGNLQWVNAASTLISLADDRPRP